MAYDEGVAERVRLALGDRPDISEKAMFGGLAFLLDGNMSCGVIGDELVVRVGTDRLEEALAMPHARPMDFTGRPMKGWVYVGPDGFGEDAELEGWVERGVAFASSLPAK